jgi:hypothetical protein
MQACIFSARREKLRPRNPIRPIGRRKNTRGERLVIMDRIALVLAIIGGLMVQFRRKEN